MSRRHKLWAIAERKILMAKLGGKCSWCGTRENLTFDCIVPMGDGHHKGSTDQRMCYYRRQHLEHDNVQREEGRFHH